MTFLVLCPYFIVPLPDVFCCFLHIFWPVLRLISQCHPVVILLKVQLHLSPALPFFIPLIHFPDLLWCGFLLFHSRHSRSTISPIVILHHFSDVSQVITLSFIHPVLLLSLIFLSSEKRELFALIFFDILPIQVYNINEFLFCLYWQNIRCICLRQVHYFFLCIGNRTQSPK